MSNKKIMVLGGTGLLGQKFIQRFRQAGFLKTVSLARREADIICDVVDKSKFCRILDEFGPDIIINCAAIVDLDECQDNPNSSWNVNVEPLFILNEWLWDKKCKLVQISTDHFYDYGDKVPHKESDPVRFKNTYSKHKFCAEEVALESKRALVLRTSIMGPSDYIGKKYGFWDWAVDVVLNDKPSTLFYDAFTSAIDAGSFCDIAIELIKRDTDGLLNVACSETYSKKEFVFALASRLGFLLTQTSDGSISSLSTKRASSLGLDVSRVENILSKKLPNMHNVIENLIREGSLLK